MDTTSLIAVWELEEASGTRNDSWSTNHLADNNTVLSTTGKIGDCGDFERDNAEYLNITDNLAVSMGDIDFTICAWVNMESKAPSDTDSVNTICGKRTGAVQEYYLRYNNEASLDRFQFQVSPTGTSGWTDVNADNFGSPSLATWYFIVCWHDSVNNLLGIQVNNGTANTTTSYTGGVFDGDTDFTIGGYAGANEYWDGLLDQVILWKRILTTDEKTYLYNSGDGRTYAQIIAAILDQTHYRWRADDGTLAAKVY